MQIAKETSDDIRQIKSRYGIVGNSPALTEALQRALKVAPIDLTVLVNGESGTGKEFFPKIIHNNSPRKHARYIAVNCGAIPEGTIDSELFGHEKGSFTGAVNSRKGYFEEADGGTVFLDEVAELPLTTQARLLRVLESGEFLKVGSSTVQKANVRIVAATNVDLTQAVAKGRFREDLYYRLSTVGISIPPLRQRGADIMLLARKFAADFSEKYRTSGIGFSEQARNIMLRYSWPGNVRQLKNAVEQMSLFEAGDTITADTARRYLPDTPALVPALQTTKQYSYQAERDMLFSMIFNLQQRLEDLRQDVAEKHDMSPARHRDTAGETIPAVTRATDRHIDFTDFTEEPCAAKPGENVIGSINISPNEDISLEKSEKNLIKKALEQSDGHRKAAAAQLGISERTLYRKIKEYGLEP